MNKQRLVLVAAAFLVYASSSLGTSVRPPQPDELIGGADWVATGVVTAVRCEWRENAAGRHIFTIVTFKPQDRWIGPPIDEVELVFLGGELDGRGLQVAGQPQFEVGMQQLLFVANNGTQLCPVVRMGYGRFHLQPDESNRKLVRVFRQDLSPLYALEDVAQSLQEGPANETNLAASVSKKDWNGLNLTQLRQLVVDRATSLGRQDVVVAQTH